MKVGSQLCTLFPSHFTKDVGTCTGEVVQKDPNMSKTPPFLPCVLICMYKDELWSSSCGQSDFLTPTVDRTKGLSLDPNHRSQSYVSVDKITYISVSGYVLKLKNGNLSSSLFQHFIRSTGIDIQLMAILVCYWKLVLLSVYYLYFY